MGPIKVRYLAKNQHASKEKNIKFLRWMSVHQKLGIILENKVVQTFSLEKTFLPKKLSLNWYS